MREREKILDEKIVRRTEEVPDPITGQPQLRTVEYIEKIIETEVRQVKKKNTTQYKINTTKLLYHIHLFFPDIFFQIGTTN